MMRSNRAARRIIQFLALSAMTAAVIVPLEPATAGNNKDHEWRSWDDGRSSPAYGGQGYYYGPGPSYYAPPPAYYYPQPPQSYYVPPALGLTLTVPLRHD
jgi:hypothetical protein